MAANIMNTYNKLIARKNSFIFNLTRERERGKKREVILIKDDICFIYFPNTDKFNKNIFFLLCSSTNKITLDIVMFLSCHE